MTAITSPAKSPALELKKVLRGPAFGVRQPLFIASLRVSSNVTPSWAKIDEAMGRICGEDAEATISANQNTAIQFASRALGFARKLQVAAGVPLFEYGRILDRRSEGLATTSVSILMPYAPGSPARGFDTLLRICQTLENLIVNNCAAEVIDLAMHDIDKVKQELAKSAPRGTNMLRFIKAANDDGIPWDVLFGAYYQFGWGSRQCMLDSSILGTTSSIGVSIARNKFGCAHILRRAGLPVPEHHLVAKLDDAFSAARRLGYPLVVKPSNLDGGVGVAAGLQDDEQLAVAFAEASRHSKSILIERHQAGEDFRLIVLDGNMLWAVGRQPAAVTGDGVSTIATLVGQANADPRRGNHAAATLRPIKLDQEALDLLAQQGLAEDGVPEVGRLVKLRRSANISSGGTPLLLTEQVHPDNKSLAERAVNVLGLDLAGVDLIVPDITRSWRETGGAIIEINAQPQLVAASQNHLYHDILNARVPFRGRIPVVVALGPDTLSQFMFGAFEQLQRERVRAGFVSASGTWLPDTTQGCQRLSIFDGARAVLAQRDADALLVVVDERSILESGLPIDQFDTLVVSNSTLAGSAGSVPWMQRALAMVVPHCAGSVLSDAPAAAHELQKYGLRKSVSTRTCGAQSDLMDAVARSVLDSEIR